MGDGWVPKRKSVEDAGVWQVRDVFLNKEAAFKSQGLQDKEKEMLARQGEVGRGETVEGGGFSVGRPEGGKEQGQ